MGPGSGAEVPVHLSFYCGYQRTCGLNVVGGVPAPLSCGVFGVGLSIERLVGPSVEDH